MKTQPCTWPEGRTLARRTDPETSHQAAERVAEFAQAHRDRIVSAMRFLAFDVGAEDIAAHTGMDAYAIRKRLPEMQRDGLVEPTGETRATSSGRRERVWRLK